MEGSFRLGKRVGHARTYLEEIGLEPERLGLVQLPAGNQKALDAAVDEILARARNLKVNPTRTAARKKE